MWLSSFELEYAILYFCSRWIPLLSKSMLNVHLLKVAKTRLFVNILFLLIQMDDARVYTEIIEGSIANKMPW